MQCFESWLDVRNWIFLTFDLDNAKLRFNRNLGIYVTEHASYHGVIILKLIKFSTTNTKYKV